MGWAFAILHWIAFFLEILFATVCIAAGLFYITEVIEDYTSISRSFFKWSNIAVVGAYLTMFLFEGTGTLNLILGILTFIMAWQVIEQFPNIEMVSPSFMGLIVCMILNHVTAYWFFKDRFLSFSQIIAYFTICVWLVPIQLILGLVAGENILPTSSNSRGSNFL
ncbi:protein TEX261-like [Bolinopsis microptera]|uniref:protein TEX261-like n=1 Tax=Bolinopsis microptera TaxID=2820187 RepID=UPI003079CB3D